MAKENVSLDFRLKNRWKKKLSFRRYITQWFNEQKAWKSAKDSKLLPVCSCFRFCCQLLCFNFHCCFISYRSCSYCKLCNRIKNLYNDSGIKKYKSIIKKKKKARDNTAFLSKPKINTIQVLIFKGLIYSHIFFMRNVFQCYMFFDEKIGSGAIVITKEGTNVNEVLAQELCNPVTKKSKKRKG